MSEAQAPTLAPSDRTPARHRLYIDGQWHEAVSGETREIQAPATGRPLAVVAEAGAPDIDRAVGAAADALHDGWGNASPSQRAKALRRLSELVVAHADELAALESANVGKPIREAAALDVPTAVGVLDYYAGWADKAYGETIPHSLLPVLNYTVKEPIGVVGAIVPWNFPLVIALWKIAPALAVGNTVVLKPSALTPLSVLRLCELASEADLPPGVLNVVTGDGAQAGEALVTDPRVAKIAFTGSTEVGRRIMALAAPTLKKLTLECGGKSPNIVFADADLDRAVEATLFGIFANQGEVCAAGSRLLVESSIRDDFVERLVRRARALCVGDPADPATEIGPLISGDHLSKVQRLVAAGVDEGADVLCGGGPVVVDGLDGSFFAPTILDQVTNGMTVAQQEIFGPVLSVITFDGDAEAIRIANDTMYGLVANVHTENIGRAHRVAAGLQCGTVYVNLPPIPFTEAPIGGYKQTGLGKDLGPHAIDEYLLTKSVVVGLTPPGQHFRWFAAAEAV